MDPNLGRATLFHGAEIVRIERLDVSAFTPMVAVSTDGAGALILVSDNYWPYIEESWVGAAFARYVLSTARTDTLARFDYVPRWIRGQTVNPLRPRGWAAASPRNLVSTRSDRTQVERYTLDGRLVQLIRWTEDRQPFDQDTWWTDFEAYQRSFKSPSPQLDEGLARWRDAAEGPLPYSAGILADDAGNVWVGEFKGDPRYPPRYRVFSDSGVFQGFVVMPARFEVLDLAHGFVLGVHRDELDVAAVALYRLEE